MANSEKREEGEYWQVRVPKPSALMKRVGLKSTVQCPRCGKSILPEFKICPYCGASMESSLAALQTMGFQTAVTCQNCGKATPADSRFCANCGARLAESTASSRRCQKCGAEITPDSTRFCANCGAPLPPRRRDHMKRAKK